MSRLGPTGLMQLLTNIKTWVTTKLGNYVTTDTTQTITGKKLFTNSTTQVNSVNTFTGSTLFIDTSASAPRGSFPESAYRVGRIYIGDGTSYNGSWFIIDPTIDTNKAFYRMVTTNPDNTDSTRFSIVWDSTKTGARRRKNVSQGDLLPSANNTYNLGAADLKWDSAYVTNLYINGTQFVPSEVMYLAGNETVTGTKIFNGDKIVITQGNGYRMVCNDNGGSSGYGVFQRVDSANWYFMVTAQDDALGTWTSARPITIRLSDGYCTINGKADEANKVYTTIAAGTTTALVQASVASNDCFRIAAGGAANAGWAEIATGDDANEPIYVRQYKGSFTTLQRTATLLDGSGNTSFPGTVTATGFSGPVSDAPSGTTYVGAVADGGAVVNSQTTGFGAIWRAPTKNYQVAAASWPSNSDNVYICYSVANTDVTAGNNTVSKSLIWNADNGTLTTTTFSGALSGNASTATQFSANKSVTLTGDVTGTASSKAGWSVATTLSNSGVTAGTYGPSADVTGNNNATISVPEITVDSKGRVTSVTNRTLTCKNNTYNVYNKTLTIQKNGTNVATFTSNSNTNVTANITVPTKVSELTNDSGYLTAHQSLSNYVTIDTAQDIEGNKNFKGLLTTIPNGTIWPVTASTTDDITYLGANAIHVEQKGSGKLTDLSNGAWSVAELGVGCFFFRINNGTDIRYKHLGQNTVNRIPVVSGANRFINDVTPNENNTYSLGTSSLRWKTCYSNAYYLGTTAFGDIVTHNASEFLTTHPSISINPDPTSNYPIKLRNGSTFTYVSGIDRDANGHVSVIYTTEAMLNAHIPQSIATRTTSGTWTISNVPKGSILYIKGYITLSSSSADSYDVTLLWGADMLAGTGMSDTMASAHSGNNIISNILGMILLVNGTGSSGTTSVAIELSRGPTYNLMAYQ